jgi:predicted RNase H-like nuclease (RuvC/YqgF family)
MAKTISVEDAQAESALATQFALVTLGQQLAKQEQIEKSAEIRESKRKREFDHAVAYLRRAPLPGHGSVVYTHLRTFSRRIKTLEREQRALRRQIKQLEDEIEVTDEMLSERVDEDDDEPVVKKADNNDNNNRCWCVAPALVGIMLAGITSVVLSSMS